MNIQSLFQGLFCLPFLYVYSKRSVNFICRIATTCLWYAYDTLYAKLYFWPAPVIQGTNKLLLRPMLEDFQRVSQSSPVCISNKNNM
jgi:hypothetical protein